jgi:ankyrin repeat protein
VRLSASASTRRRWVDPAARLPCRETALHAAAGNGHFETIEELLLRGADVAIHDDNE